MANNIFIRLKEKWGINSNWDLFLINVVFALAGMSIVWVRKPIFALCGIQPETPFVLKFFLWLLVVFPTYQLGLIVYGTLLGQFSFFWKKEKQLFRFLFRIKKKEENSLSSS